MTDDDFNIMGVDPSLSATGLFFTAHDRGETIKTRPKDGDRRLVDIAGTLESMLAFWVPTFCVLEDLPISARAAGKTGMAHGVIREAILAEGLDYVTLPPATLKKAAVGSGRAEKGDMIDGYRAAYPGVQIDDDNQADAAWLAECGRALLGLPHKLAHPQSLDKYIDKLPGEIRTFREGVLASRS